MKKQLLITVGLCFLGMISYSQDPEALDTLNEQPIQIYKAADINDVIDIYRSNEINGYDAVELDTIKKPLGIELGVNISPLFQRLISPATPFNSAGQELVMLNIKVGESVYWRNGFNSTFQKSTDLQENEFTSTFSQTFVRTGVEWRRPVTEKLELHSGLDFLFDRFVSKFDFDGGAGNMSTTDRITNSLGVGVPLGVTYWINDKIGLWVESSLVGTRSKMTDVNTFDGQEVSNQESNFTNFRIKLPVSIFVKMAF